MTPHDTAPNASKNNGGIKKEGTDLPRLLSGGVDVDSSYLITSPPHAGGKIRMYVFE